MPAINDRFFVVNVIHYFEVEMTSEWPGIVLIMHASIITYFGYSAVDAAWKLH
jgi:hypothetical protein